MLGALVVAKDISKDYGGRRILDHSEFSIGKGLTAITGPSGVGKTTLLRMIYGLERPDEGTISVSQTKGRIQFVPATGDNIASLSVKDNLSIVEGDEMRIFEALKKVGLSGKEDSLVKNLSSGESERLSVARVYLSGSPLILLDEPTANLNDEYAEDVFRLLKDKSKTSAIVMATHNDPLAIRFANRVYEIKDLGVKLVKDAPSPMDSLSEALSPKGLKLPIWRLGLKKAFIKKWLYAASSIGLLAAMTVLFLGASSSLINEDEVAISEIKSQKDESLRVYWPSKETEDEALKKTKAMGEGAFRAFPLVMKDPYGHTEEGRCALECDISGLYQLNDKLSSIKNGRSESGFSIDEDGLKKGSINYPLAISEKALSYIETRSLKEYSQGDTLPLTLTDSDSEALYSASFFLAETFDGKEGEGSKLSSFAPMLISEGDYDDIMAKDGSTANGLFDSSFVQSFNSYCLDNDIPSYQIPFSESFFDGNAVGPSSFFLPFYSWSSSLPTDRAIVHYSGRIPSKKGEIMVPSAMAFEYFGKNFLEEFPDYGNLVAPLRGFQSEYPEGYPCYGGTMFDQFPIELSASSFEVVGYYQILGPAYLDSNGNPIETDGIVQRPYSRKGEGPSIISQDEFDALNKWRSEESGLSGGFSGSFVDRDWIIEHMDSLPSGTDLASRDVPSGIISLVANGVAVARVKANVMLMVSLILLLGSMVVSDIYFGQVRKELSHQAELISLWGWGLNASTTLFVSSSLAISAPPTFVALILGFSLLGADSSWTMALDGLSVSIAASSWLGAVTIIGVGAVVFAISLASLTLRKGKHEKR